MRVLRAASLDVGRFVDHHRRVAGADAVRRLPRAVGRAHHRRAARRDRQSQPAISACASGMLGCLDALQEIDRRAERRERRAQQPHGFVRRPPARRVRREDHGILALDRVDRDADRRDVRARHRDQRGDDAGRLRVLDDALVGHLFDDAHALLAERIAKDAEHLAAAARLRTAHAALGDAHLGEPGRGGQVAAGPRDGAAQPIDRGLIEGFGRRHRRPRARDQVGDRPLFLGSDRRSAMVVLFSSLGSRRRGGSPSSSTGIRMRIGFSRAYSSATSAVMPATRPMMKISLPAGGGKTRSCRTAASAPSMLIGSGLIARPRRVEGAHEAHAIAGDAGLGGHGRRARPTRGSVVCTRWPRPGSAVPLARASSIARAAAVLDRFACRPPSPSLLGDHLHTAFAGAAVFVANREDAGGNGGGHRLAVAGRRQPGGGAGWRAGAVIGRRRPESRRAAPFARVGSRPRCSRKTVSTNPACRISDGDVVSTQPDVAFRRR